MSGGRLALAVAAALAVAPPAPGQQVVPGRPRLPAEADTNDWQAYYRHGFTLISENPREAREAFRWATRINPERAEPMFAFWVTLRLGTVITAGERAGVDSVRLMSMVRNPFVHRGLELYVFQVSPRIWRNKDLNGGIVAYAESNFPRAVDLLGRAIRNDPKENLWFRTTRAQAFVGMEQFDSAAVEMAAVRDVLEQEEATETVLIYQSKAFIHYAIGMLEHVRGRMAEAREAMGRALVENLGFYPAHLFLGDAALDEGRNDEAVTEYEAALMTSPPDPVLYLHYGRALANLGRTADAIAAMRQAVKLEPFYALPWLYLARLIEGSGDPKEAIAVYRGFISRTPRSDPNLSLARKWLTGLQAGAR